MDDIVAKVHNVSKPYIAHIIDKVAKVAVVREGESYEDRIWMGDPMPVEEFMTVRAAAKRLGVHENTVRNWESAGTLRGFKLPGSGFRRFHREEIEQMRTEMLSAPVSNEQISENTHKGVSGRVIDGDVL